MLTRNTERICDIGFAHIQGGQDRVPQQLSGMGRTPVGITFCDMFGHRGSPGSAFLSMVLLEVNSQCVSIFKFKCQTPGSVDMDRIALRFSSQGMEIEPRYI